MNLIQHQNENSLHQHLNQHHSNRKAIWLLYNLYVQQVTNFGYITATNVDVHNAYTFKLNDLPNHADLEATFDQYRFKKVVIHFIPLNNAIDVKDATPAVS